MLQPQHRFLGLFLAASTFFGGTFVAARAGLEYFPPLLFVALRFDIGAILMITYVLFRFPREKWMPRTRSDIAGILAAGIFAIGLANAFIFIGQQYTTSGVASIIYSLNPILTPVFAAVLLSDENLSRYGMAGMLLGFVGVALVVDIHPASLFGGEVIGQMVLFAAAVTGALGSVLIRWADSSLSSAVRTAWGLPVGALMCHILSISAGEQLSMISWTPAGLLALGYVGVFSGALAFIAYFDLLDDVGAIRGNLVFYVVPIVATLGGWILLGEEISALTVIGFLTIFLGFAIIGHRQLTAELSRLRGTLASKPVATVLHRNTTKDNQD